MIKASSVELAAELGLSDVLTHLKPNLVND